MHVYKSIIFCCFSGSFHSPSRLPDLFVPAASSNSSDASKITSLTGKITTEVKWRWKGEETEVEQTLTLRRATLSLHFIWSFMIWYHICFFFSFFFKLCNSSFFQSFFYVCNQQHESTDQLLTGYNGQINQFHLNVKITHPPLRI